MNSAVEVGKRQTTRKNNSPKLHIVLKLHYLATYVRPVAGCSESEKLPGHVRSWLLVLVCDFLSVFNGRIQRKLSDIKEADLMAWLLSIPSGQHRKGEFSGKG